MTMKNLKYILSILMAMTLTAAHAVDFQSTSSYLQTTSSTQMHSYGASGTSGDVGGYSVSHSGSTAGGGGSSVTSVSVPMSSTATFRPSGSNLPMAARSGVTTTDGSHQNLTKHGPRRGIGDGEGFEDEDDDPVAPGDPSPVGEGLWLLLILALGYGAFRAVRRRSETVAK